MSDSATLWAVACQAALPMGFYKQEYWSGLLCPPPGDLPDPGIEPLSLTSPALAGEFFTTSATQKKYRDEKIAYTSGGGGVGWGVGITDPTRNLYKLQVQLLGGRVGHCLGSWTLGAESPGFRYWLPQALTG